MHVHVATGETGLTRQPNAVAIAGPADFGVNMRIGMIIGVGGETLSDLVKSAQRMEELGFASV